VAWTEAHTVLTGIEGGAGHRVRYRWADSTHIVRNRKEVRYSDKVTSVKHNKI
jgi:hypothetical protein